MATCAAVLVAVLPAAAPASGAPGRWSAIGPSGQDVLAVAVAPWRPASVLVGTRSAGLFRSDDGGASWRIAGTGLAPGVPVDWLGIAAARGGPSLALAGGLPYRSDDVGASWRLIAHGLPTEAGLTAGWLDPTDAQVATVGGAAGLFRSDDGGAHWHALGKGLPAGGRITFIAGSHGNAGTLLVGVASTSAHGGHVFRSLDGGATWREGRGLSPGIVPWRGAWSQGQARTAWVAAGTVYRTDDAGAHWQADGFGLPPHPFIQGLARLRDDTLFVALPAGLYRRDPGATAWTPVPDPWPATALVHQLLGMPDGSVLAATGSGLYAGDRAGQSWRDRSAGLPSRANVYALLADPASSRLYAGGDDGIWQRVGGGLWEATGAGLPVGAAVRTLVALPGPPRRILAATDYGVFFSSPAVDRWTIAAGPLVARSVSALSYAQATGTVYAAVAGGGIYAAPSGSLHWRLLPARQRLGYVRVLLADRLGKWILANGFRSTDGGRAWRAGPGGLLALLQVQERPDLVLAGTAAQGLLRSTDGGATWAPVRAGIDAAANVPVLAEGGASGGRALWSIADGRLVRSDDLGASWQPVAPPMGDVSFTSLQVLPGSAPTLIAGSIGAGAWSYSGTPPPAIATVTVRASPAASATPTAGPGTWTPAATSSPTPSATVTDTATATPTSSATATSAVPASDTPVSAVAPSGTPTSQEQSRAALHDGEIGHPGHTPGGGSAGCCSRPHPRWEFGGSALHTTPPRGSSQGDLAA